MNAAQTNSTSIRRVLLFLVCLAILPALCLIVISGLELRRAAIENAKREVLSLVQTMAEVQRGVTHSTHQILAALAQIDAVRDRQAQASSRLFRAVVEKNPDYINIVATDTGGDVFASSMPFEHVNLADRQHFRQALATKGFAPGEYIVTRIGKTLPSFTFAYPVLDAAGQPLGVLAAALRLERFAQLFAVSDLPADSFLAVTDRHGIRIYFHPLKEETNPIGRPIARTAWEKVKTARTPGISVHQGSDGIRRIFAFHPLCLEAGQEPYLYMWAGIPEAAVTGPANRMLARNLALLVLAAVLALAITRGVGGRMIAAPIHHLADVARAFAAGDTTVRSGLGNRGGELGALARTLDEMADILVENQERLRTIADHTYDWEYWMGPDGKLLWMSPSCEKTTGYTPAEFMKDPGLIGRMVDPRDKGRFMEHQAVEMSAEPILDVDFRIVHKSGRTVWIDHHCVPIHRADGSFLGRRVSNRDFTERKRMEQALKESEEQFRALVDGAPDPIFVEVDACFAYLNEAALGLFGAASLEQLLGRPVIDRYHPDAWKSVSQRLETVRSEKRRVPKQERVCLRLDGTPIPVESSAAPVVFEGRNGVLIFLQDISERRQIEAHLQQAQKMEAIGALAGGIAHDFNNLLFPILGLSEILIEDLPEGSLERENVAEIIKAARRAADLVNQILSFSRQAEHKKIPIRIQQVLKEVGKLVRATIPANIEIRQDIQADCGPVLADPTNLHQVAMNLVTNAFHAVEQNGGAIGIELQQTTLGAEDTAGTSLAPGDYARLTVSDNGSGIPADLLPKIFDPYFTTKPQGKGTGLGLSVVYGIVKEHGGEIRVRSDVGQGTAFTIYLPLIPKDETSGPPAAAAVHPTGSERILLVDDEEAVARMEKQMLERLGYRVTTCTGSIEALETFKADPAAFDLIITDMSMPRLTGDRMARQMMALKPGLPVILCTGFSEQITPQMAASMGIKGFLMKPVVRGELAATVRKLLDAVNSEGRG